MCNAAISCQLESKGETTFFWPKAPALFMPDMHWGQAVEGQEDPSFTKFKRPKNLLLSGKLIWEASPHIHLADWVQPMGGQVKDSINQWESRAGIQFANGGPCVGRRVLTVE